MYEYCSIVYFAIGTIVDWDRWVHNLQSNCKNGNRVCEYQWAPQLQRYVWRVGYSRPPLLLPRPPPQHPLRPQLLLYIVWVHINLLRRKFCKCWQLQASTVIVHRSVLIIFKNIMNIPSGIAPRFSPAGVANPFFSILRMRNLAFTREYAKQRARKNHQDKSARVHRYHYRGIPSSLRVSASSLATRSAASVREFANEKSARSRSSVSRNRATYSKGKLRGPVDVSVWRPAPNAAPCWDCCCPWTGVAVDQNGCMRLNQKYLCSPKRMIVP